MDSITQIALGAAVGEATLGRRIGNRALLWGGVCGLLPDLDLFVPFGDVVKSFIYHRSFSHSIFVLALLTPLFVKLILKVHPDTGLYRNRWYGLVFLAFATHVVLDCFTVYGTQIFWPLPTPPVMWSSIFIIDPAYSLPLFFGVLAALVMSRKVSVGHRINTVCLVLSTIYLMGGVGAKLYVEQVARSSLQQQRIAYNKLLTVPTPFNTLLWRVLITDDKGYYEGFYSLLDATAHLKVTHYPSDRHLLEGLDNHWPVKRLRWFTHGFYSVERHIDDILITDLRMGLEPSYVFRFKVARMSNPHAQPTKSRRVAGERNWEKLLWVWQRIWSTDPGFNRRHDSR